MRVLVIEGDAELAVDVAFDGGSGLQRALVTDYDVVVLDRDLPALDGDEVCAELVAAGGRSRVLMLTASSTGGDRVDRRALGADDYLQSRRFLEEQWADAAFAARGIETAEQWWDAVASECAFAPLLGKQAARFAGKRRQESLPGFDFHVAALHDAGFREVGTIWQLLANRVLLAVR